MERDSLHGFKAAPENGFVGRGFALPRLLIIISKFCQSSKNMDFIRAFRSVKNSQNRHLEVASGSAWLPCVRIFLLNPEPLLPEDCLGLYSIRPQGF